MKPKEVFGIVVRVFGLVLMLWGLLYFLYLAGWMAVRGHLVAGAAAFAYGIYLLHGAPLLVRFAYRETEDRLERTEETSDRDAQLSTLPVGAQRAAKRLDLSSKGGAPS